MRLNFARYFLSRSPSFFDFRCSLETANNLRPASLMDFDVWQI